MTCATHDKELAAYVDDSSSTRRSVFVTLTGVLRRIADAIYESRQRQADREIARFIAQSGGRLTDDIERQMMRRLSTSNLSLRD